MVHRFQQYQAAEDLERYLGDPLHEDQAFSFKRSVALDESETYPKELFEVLSDWNFEKHLVPALYGGKMVSLEEFLAITRAIARRDLTVAVGCGVNFLGSASVWLAGSDALKQRTAELLLDGQKLSFAVSEEDHGHDLLASDFVAKEDREGYRLFGKKWTIGNATYSAAFTLFTKSSEEGGSRGFTAFFVDKSELDPSTIRNTPKIKTLGLRSHDLSGIELTGSYVPNSAVIGEVGQGFEIVNKCILITRTLCASLSLGAADTALRTLMDFAQSRQLYGATQSAIPHVQNTLVDTFIDILICDCLTTSTVRAWHFATDEMGLWAPIAKYFAPHKLEKSIQALTVTFGARSFLRESHQYGIFQKIYRDVPIISIFEGNAHPQLHTISMQLKHILTKKTNMSQEKRKELLSAIFSLDHEIVQFFDLSKLDLHSHGQDIAIQGLDIAMEKLADLKDTKKDQVMEDILYCAQELQNQLNQLKETVLQQKVTAAKTARQLYLGRMYSTLHAAACCLHLWIYNYGKINAFFDQGEWLVLALTKLLINSDSIQFDENSEYIRHVMKYLSRLHEQNKSFAVIPIELGKGVNPNGNKTETHAF